MPRRHFQPASAGMTEGGTPPLILHDGLSTSGPAAPGDGFTSSAELSACLRGNEDGRATPPHSALETLRLGFRLSGSATGRAESSPRMSPLCPDRGQGVSGSGRSRLGGIRWIRRFLRRRRSRCGRRAFGRGVGGGGRRRPWGEPGRALMRALWRGPCRRLRRSGRTQRPFCR